MAHRAIQDGIAVGRMAAHSAPRFVRFVASRWWFRVSVATVPPYRSKSANPETTTEEPS